MAHEREIRNGTSPGANRDSDMHNIGGNDDSIEESGVFSAQRMPSDHERKTPSHRPGRVTGSAPTEKELLAGFLSDNASSTDRRKASASGRNRAHLTASLETQHETKDGDDSSHIPSVHDTQNPSSNPNDTNGSPLLKKHEETRHRLSLFSKKTEDHSRNLQTAATALNAVVSCKSVCVFTSRADGGNQVAVIIDRHREFSSKAMQRMAERCVEYRIAVVQVIRNACVVCTAPEFGIVIALKPR
jgi:hypothetical protein